MIVVDDFLDGIAERQKALAAQYETLKYDGFGYPGMSQTEDFVGVDRISELIGKPVNNASVLFRYYCKEMEQEGFIHSDANVAVWTGIVFLSEPKSERDGLALWQHKESGTLSFPDSPEILAQCGGWEKLRADGFDESKWWMTEFVPMKLGRLALFTGARWHSRYPQAVDNSGIEDARLIKVFFWT